jgi:hypothetical protein
MFVNVCSSRGVCENWADAQIESARTLSKIYTDNYDDDEIIDIIVPNVKAGLSQDSIQKIVTDVVIKIYTSVPNGAVVYVDHLYPLAFNIILSLLTISVVSAEGMSAKYLVVDAEYDTNKQFNHIVVRDQVKKDGRLPFLSWREYSPIILTKDHFMSYAKSSWTTDTNPTSIYLNDIALDTKLNPDL